MATAVEQAHRFKLTGKAAEVAICDTQQTAEGYSGAVVDDLAHQLDIGTFTGSVQRQVVQVAPQPGSSAREAAITQNGSSRHEGCQDTGNRDARSNLLPREANIKNGDGLRWCGVLCVTAELRLKGPHRSATSATGQGSTGHVEELVSCRHHPVSRKP
jgi:hypothetical protein